MATLMTPEFRVSFPNVFKARLNDQNGKMEYSVVALFPKGADLSALKKAATEAIEKKWGTDQKKWPKNLRTPFRDQSERVIKGTDKLQPGHEAGAIFINLKSAQKPGVVDQNVQDIINEQEFYSGCYARATVNAFAYDTKGNVGVAFGLQNIQKTRDGEPLGGRLKPQAEFAPIEGAGTEDSTSIF